MTRNARDTQIYRILMSNTKSIIDSYRRLFECEVKASLRKEEMAFEVADYMLNRSAEWMQMLPLHEIRILDELVKHKAGYEYNAGHLPYPTILGTFKLLDWYPDEKNNVVFYASQEMLEAFKDGFKDEEIWLFSRDAHKLEAYVMGILCLYGVIPEEKLFCMLIDIMESLGEKSINAYYLLHYYLPCRIHRYIFDDGVYFYHPAISDPEYFIREQNSRKEIGHYKEFRPEEIFEAGRNTPFCTGGINLPESKSLLETLKRINGKNYEEITEYGSFFIMAQEENIRQMVEELFKGGMADMMMELKDSADRLINFSNSLPRWNLKGYSSKEVFEKFEKPQLRPLKSPEKFQNYEGNLPDPRLNSMINFRAKIGRNDPCPCGSGRKYKNCHGKYES